MYKNILVLMTYVHVYLQANEQHRRFEDLLQVCRQVNPQLDISYFVNALNPDCAKLEIKRHRFHPVEASSEVTCIQ